MKPIGLRFKLILLYSASFALLLTLSLVASYYLFQNQLEAEMTEELRDRAEALRGYIHFDKDQLSLVYNDKDPELAQYARTVTRYHQIYSLATGDLVAQSPEMQLLGLAFVPEEIRTISQRTDPLDVETDDGWLRFLNDRVASPSGKEYLVQVGISMEPVRFALGRFYHLSLILAPCGLFVAAGMSWLLAGSVLRPVRRITQWAREIGPSSLDRRLPLTGSGDELDHLAMTFNDVFGRLDNAVGELRQATGSIAHELRTPIAALRGESELALLHAQSIEEFKEVLISQIEEFDKLNRMISQLLTFSRVEGGEIQFDWKPFDVAAIVENVADTFNLLASTKGISFESVPGKDLIATIDPQWLERVLVNILDNAIKYTRPGGRISIRGALDSDTVRVEVEDNGEGISAEGLPHIFERFYRADPSRNREMEGVGLGLSFAKWIIDQHGGTIHVTSQKNQGSCFTIRLPRSMPN